MLQSISDIFISYLIRLSQRNIDHDEKEVLIYGLECFLNTSIVCIVLGLWGIFTHRLTETVIWIIVFSVARHFAGGLHAPSELSCILSSICLGISNTFFIRHFSMHLYGTLFCLIICSIFAPTDTGKFDLFPTQRRNYKLISILIILLSEILSLIIEESPAITSVRYALFCVYVLVGINEIIHLRRAHASDQ